MSEYLSKKAVLEHIRREIGITERQQDAVMTRHMKEFHGGAIRALQNFEHAVQSGAFDADNTEIQRLRAALEKARTYIFNGYDLGYIDDREGCTKPLLHQIDEALSTTTEPINAEKVKRIECPCCGCEISINAPKGDGNDA